MDPAQQIMAVPQELLLARAQQQAARVNHEQVNEQYEQCLAQVNETVKTLIQRVAQLEGSLVQKEEEKNTLIAAHHAELKAMREENGQLIQAVADLGKEILGLQQRQDAERRRFDAHQHGADIRIFYRYYPNQFYHPNLIKYEPTGDSDRPQFARGVTGTPQ